MEFGKVLHTFKSRKGNMVEFRYPTKDEFQPLWNFACDLAAEDTFVELSGLPPKEAEEKKWFETMIKDVENRDAIYVHAYTNNRFIGNGRVLKGKYRHSHVGHMGISLVPEFREEGIGTELMQTLIKQAPDIGIRVLELSCFENNSRALHVYEKLGFIKIGTMPAAIAWKGGYVGEVKMYLPLVS